MQEERRLWNGVVKKMPASNVCASVSQQELIALEGELQVLCSLGEEVGGAEETLGSGECLEESALEARYSALPWEVGQD